MVSNFFIFICTWQGKIDVCITLLQHGADVNIRNTEGKTALEVADASTKPVLTGEYRKDELLEAARSGNEERLLQLLNPLNVNCHASDGRRSTPLHLAAGYNRSRVVQILLQNGADVHAKDKGLVNVYLCGNFHLYIWILMIMCLKNLTKNLLRFAIKRIFQMKSLLIFLQGSCTAS